MNFIKVSLLFVFLNFPNVLKAQFDFTIEPIKSKFSELEPLVFDAKFVNRGKDRVIVNLGHNRVGNIEGIMADGTKCVLYGRNRSGLIMTSNLSLDAGQEYQQILIVEPLNKFASDSKILFKVKETTAKAEVKIELKKKAEAEEIGISIAKLVEMFGPNSMQLRDYLMCIMSLDPGYVKELNLLKEMGVLSNAAFDEALSGLNAVD